MKEATGELGTTVLVIIAIIAVLGILTLFVLPTASNWISGEFNQFNKTNCQVDSNGKVKCN